MPRRSFLEMGVTETVGINGFCKTCECFREVERVENSDNLVFCLDCGTEFRLMSKQEEKFQHYVVGKILLVEDISKNKSKSLSKVSVLIKEGPNPLYINIVTNAKHVETGILIVVATEDAIVPAGAVLDENVNAFKVKEAIVSGHKSQGILCDCPMLDWNGGAAGVLVKLSDDFKVGDLPPLERPRNH